MVFHDHEDHLRSRLGVRYNNNNVAKILSKYTPQTSKHFNHDDILQSPKSKANDQRVYGGQDIPGLSLITDSSLLSEKAGCAIVKKDILNKGRDGKDIQAEIDALIKKASAFLSKQKISATYSKNSGLHTTIQKKCLEVNEVKRVENEKDEKYDKDEVVVEQDLDDNKSSVMTILQNQQMQIKQLQDTLTLLLSNHMFTPHPSKLDNARIETKSQEVCTGSSLLLLKQEEFFSDKFKQSVRCENSSLIRIQSSLKSSSQNEELSRSLLTLEKKNSVISSPKITLKFQPKEKSSQNTPSLNKNITIEDNCKSETSLYGFSINNFSLDTKAYFQKYNLFSSILQRKTQTNSCDNTAQQ